jgi:hypothetical protein
MNKYLILLIIFVVLSCQNKQKKNYENYNLQDNGEIEKADDNLTNGDIYKSTIETDEGVNKDFNELKNKEWQYSLGNYEFDNGITNNELVNTSWHKDFTVLRFSEKGQYAVGDRWSGCDFGNYELKENEILFYPPFKINRYDEVYSVKKLKYSNELYYVGSPVLTEEDDSIVFAAYNSKDANINDTVKINTVYCIKIYEKARININNILYVNPDVKAKNLFSNNPYGNKTVDAITRKLAHVNLGDKQWYYVLVDFSGGEPTDGGGPFYYGWLPEQYLIDVYGDDVEIYKYNGGIKICIDTLNVREKPTLNAVILNRLTKGDEVEIKGRTITPERIDSKNNYWYYVMYKIEYEYFYGYVFGAYLE